MTATKGPIYRMVDKDLEYLEERERNIRGTEIDFAENREGQRILRELLPKIQELESQSLEGWISDLVMPKETWYYLVFRDWGCVCCLWYKERLWYFVEWMFDSVATDVTHWQPLPPPPSK